MTHGNKRPARFRALLVALCCALAGQSLPVRSQTASTPDQIRALAASFTLDSVPVLLSTLHGSDARCREEALFALERLPELPPWEEAPLIEAAIDLLGDASETIRFQAVKALAIRFPDRERARQALAELATPTIPAELIGWARDRVFEGGRRNAEARTELNRLASEADAKLRAYLQEAPLLESASRTRGWLLKEPGIQAVEVSRDGLWFTTSAGLESGLLLDAYRGIATRSAPAASGAVPLPRAPR
ncbi:MAG TPA: hypothetical protein PLP29_10045 [Candidatus Ozemobacteraceae bacterium]|nr:hypothetical protein [Candidatus Ozemobacteraceae bacterium]